MACNGDMHMLVATAAVAAAAVEIVRVVQFIAYNSIIGKFYPFARFYPKPKHRNKRVKERVRQRNSDRQRVREREGKTKSLKLCTPINLKQLKRQQQGTLEDAAKVATKHATYIIHTYIHIYSILRIYSSIYLNLYI